jgi:hypothetical protein
MITNQSSMAAAFERVSRLRENDPANYTMRQRDLKLMWRAVWNNRIRTLSCDISRGGLANIGSHTARRIDES